MRHNKFLLLVCGLLLLTLTASGVFAAWIYYSPPEPAEDNISMSMGEWKYYAYTVTYIHNIDNEEKLHVEYQVADNSTPYDVDPQQELAAIVEANMKEAYPNVQPAYKVKGWMTAGSNVLTSIPAGHKKDVTLYPSFVGRYTATFVDQAGNVLYSEIFNEGTPSLTYVPDAPVLNELIFSHWEIRTDKQTSTGTEYKDGALSKVKSDITLYPIYTYKTYNGSAKLIPVDADGDGSTDFWQVAGYSNGTGSKLVEIPGKAEGKDVTTINANAFKSYADLTAVRIPQTITTIGSDAFAEFEGLLQKRQTVTLYYEGVYNDQGRFDANATLAAWNNISKSSSWDNAMGEGSRIFFLDKDGNVVNTSYLELDKEGNIFNQKFVWKRHSHPFPYNSSQGTCTLDHNQNNTDYDAANRVDKDFWIP